MAGADLAQGALMPGYTHLQRAQPVRRALAHRTAWTRDAERRTRWGALDRCPLPEFGGPPSSTRTKGKLSDSLFGGAPPNSMDSVRSDWPNSRSGRRY